MSRHARPSDATTRLASLVTVLLVWVAGLGAGFYALLGIVARYGCTSSQHGLGCGNGGTTIGVLLLLGVIATVTTVTVVVHGRTALRVALIGAAGLVALAACVLGGHALLATV